MAIYPLYDRRTKDNVPVGVIDTNICSYYNITSPGEYRFSTSNYPYIKVYDEENNTSTYYLNDGSVWDLKSVKSAAVITIKESYRETWNEVEYMPLKDLQFIESEKAESFSVQKLGNKNQVGVLPLENYRFNGNNLKSLTFKKNQEISSTNLIDEEKDLPFVNSDNQVFLQGKLSFSDHRYFWDFIPELKNYYLFDNFSDKSEDKLEYTLTVKDDVVKLSQGETEISTWALKYTPFMTFGIKRPEYNDWGAVPFRVDACIFGYGWPSEWWNKVVYNFNSDIHNEGPSLVIVGYGEDRATYEFALGTDIKFLSIKLYNGFSITFSPTFYKINTGSSNSFDHIGEGLDNNSVLREFYDYRELSGSFGTWLWNGKKERYISETDYKRYDIVDDSTNDRQFRGFDLNFKCQDIVFKENAKDESGQQASFAFASNTQETLELNKLKIGGYDAEEDAKDQERELKNITINYFQNSYKASYYNGTIPFYLQLLKEEEITEENKNGSYKVSSVKFFNYEFKECVNTSNEPVSFPYVPFTGLFRYMPQAFGKKTMYVFGLSTELGIVSDGSVGVSLIGSNSSEDLNMQEDNIYYEFLYASKPADAMSYNVAYKIHNFNSYKAQVFIKTEISNKEFSTSTLYPLETETLVVNSVKSDPTLTKRVVLSK